MPNSQSAENASLGLRETSELSAACPGRPATALVVLAVVFLSGCAIKLAHGDLQPPEALRTGELPYERIAAGPQGRVGWGRGTVFAIPMVPIYIQGDDSYGGEEMMNQVRDAIVTAGYAAVVVDPQAPPDGAALRCSFKASFSNYTWIFPIVPTWGSIDLVATLVTRSGDTIWNEEFKGDGFTLNFFNGYNSAAKQSVTEILNDLVQALASDDFQRALDQARGPSRSQT